VAGYLDSARGDDTVQMLARVDNAWPDLKNVNSK
jgi:hypothetical protein